MAVKVMKAHALKYVCTVDYHRLHESICLNRAWCITQWYYFVNKQRLRCRKTRMLKFRSSFRVACLATHRLGKK